VICDRTGSGLVATGDGDSEGIAATLELDDETLYRLQLAKSRQCLLRGGEIEPVDARLTVSPFCTPSCPSSELGWNAYTLKPLGLPSLKDGTKRRLRALVVAEQFATVARSTE